GGRRRRLSLRHLRHAGSVRRCAEGRGVSRRVAFPDRLRRGRQRGRRLHTGRGGHAGPVNFGAWGRTWKRTGRAGLDHETVHTHGVTVRWASTLKPFASPV